MQGGVALVAEVVEVGDGDGGDQAIDAEEVPASRLKPPAEPLQRKQSSKKSEDHADDAWCGGGNYSGELMVLGLIEAPNFARVRWWGEHDGEGEAEIFGRSSRDAQKQAGGDGCAGTREATEGNAQALDGADQ